MRVVITGGPSVGKTTIITGLAQLGFTVVEEFATKIIKEGVLLPWVDRVAFQTEVLRQQLFAEESLKLTEEIVFLDRGLFDGEAYYIKDKLPIPEIFSTLDASQYTVAFLIEQLDTFDQNEVRREDIEFTNEITTILEECYKSRGVEVIRVPAMPPEPRVEYVLTQVRDLIGLKVKTKAPDMPLSMDPELKLSLTVA
jgi:predicted ATPase